jgi:hypothetical protein
MALAGTAISAAAQDLPWQGREYGIGVVRYEAMYRYDAKDVVRAAPFAGADTVATLVRDSLCFRRPPRCVRSYEQMIEFDYEVTGWAILEFSGDSSWVKVSLAPAQTSGAVGWVQLQPDSVTAFLWSGILPRHRLFFLREPDIAFYKVPAPKARVDRRLATHPGSAELNYIMNPLAVRGTWLRVELLSPSPYCESAEIKVAPDTLWIQYLTDRGRPQVFFYTRGC